MKLDARFGYPCSMSQYWCCMMQLSPHPMHHWPDTYCYRAHISFVRYLFWPLASCWSSHYCAFHADMLCFFLFVVRYWVSVRVASAAIVCLLANKVSYFLFDVVWRETAHIGTPTHIVFTFGLCDIFNLAVDWLLIHNPHSTAHAKMLCLFLLFVLGQ